MKRSYFHFFSTVLLLFFSCSEEETHVKKVDSTPPSLSVSINGLTVTDSNPLIVGKLFSVILETKDESGIKDVSIYIDGDLIEKINTPPYSKNINSDLLPTKPANADNYISREVEVIAQDNAGNVVKKKVNLAIDIDIPIISDVTLKKETILNGELNPVEFAVDELQNIHSVQIRVNNQDIKYIPESFSFNINSKLYDQGENILEIAVEDHAKNIGKVTIPFIIDNIGPIIEFEGIDNNQTVIKDEEISLKLVDEYSEKNTVKLLLDDTIIKEDEGNEVVFDFIPKNYSTGKHSLKIIANDSLGNQTTKSLVITIKRVLMKISIPENYISISGHKMIFLANKSDGTLIGWVLTEKDGEIELLTEEEISLDYEYVFSILRYFDKESTNETYFNMYSIANISPAKLDVLKFKNLQQYTYRTIEDNFFELDDCMDNFYGGGSDYSFGKATYEEKFSILEKTPKNQNIEINKKAYLISEPYCKHPIQYAVIERPFQKTTIKISDLRVDGLHSETISTGSTIRKRFFLKGFNSLEGYRNNVYTRLQRRELDLQNITYSWLDHFSEFQYLYYTGNYARKARGLLKGAITIPEWSITHSQSGNNSFFDITPGPHTVGKVMYTYGKGYNPNHGVYTLVFDSEKTSSFTFPQLPESFQDKEFYSVITENKMKIRQSQIEEFEGINSFSEYLKKIVENNRNYQEIGDFQQAKCHIDEEFGVFLISDSFFRFL